MRFGLSPLFGLGNNGDLLSPGETPGVLRASTGFFVLTGNAAALKATRSLIASQASFTLTGQDTGLVYGHSGFAPTYFIYGF